MKKTVYLFGAGINYGLKNYVPNNNTAYSPPLAKNFFKMCLSQWDYISNRNHAPISHHVFDYIKKYWNLSVDDLKIKDFDLEECFTLIQLQKKDLEERYKESPDSVTQVDISTYENLDHIEFHLARLLIEYLQSFDSAINPGMMNLNIDTNTNFVSSGTSYIYGESQDILNNIERKKPFFDLGKQIIEQNATVITFNYDLLIEKVLMSLFEYERNSRHNFVRSFQAPEYWRPRIFKRGEHFSDEVFLNPNVNWKPSLAYGFDFDLIELVDPMNNFAYGQDYYELHKDKKEASIKILKPHGSLNWGWIYVDENESILKERNLFTNIGEKRLRNEKEITFPFVIPHSMRGIPCGASHAGHPMPGRKPQRRPLFTHVSSTLTA